MNDVTMTSPAFRKPEVDGFRRILCVTSLVLCCLMAGHAMDQPRDSEGHVDPGGACSSVREAYGSKGFNEHDVPHQMVNGHHLKICVQRYTCCTQEMEEKLNLKTGHEISQLIMDKLNFYRQNFVTRLIRLDEYFVKLIDQSRADLHDIFLRTYGLLYQQNVQIFVDLFRDLQSYYKMNVDIQDVLDRFFSLLMQRIFQLLNNEHSFGDGFFSCIGEHMNQLRPFGDIPFKLYLLMKRSFTAARVFVDGLATGRDVVLAMSKLEHSHDCLHELMKLTYCSYCGGFAGDIRPCTNSCLAAFKECIGYYANINRLWNSYLGEMQTLATRLDGPFNIEMVVSPLGVKLSEAVMVFQENSDSFSSKVFQGCGDPSLRHISNDSHNETRRKRDASADSFDLNLTTSQSPNPNAMPESLNHSIFGSGKASLSRIIRDVQGKLDTMRDIWKDFPELLCNETSLADSSDSPTCWNGTDVSRKSDDDGIGKSGINEDARNGLARHSNVIEKVLYDLRTVISRIKNAHSGINEEFPDNDDDLSGSGDHSGSGTDDPDPLLSTTKDIYIEGTSHSQEPTTGSSVAIASTSRPRIISTASRVNVGLQNSLIMLVATCIVNLF